MQADMATQVIYCTVQFTILFIANNLYFVLKQNSQKPDKNNPMKRSIDQIGNDDELNTKKQKIENTEEKGNFNTEIKSPDVPTKRLMNLMK